jgi:hypothetical protein
MALDMRTGKPITGFEDPPTSDAYIRFVTDMTGIFEPYFFPDVIHDTPTGPYELPVVIAKKWGVRIDEIFEGRKSVMGLLRRVEDILTAPQILELKRSMLNMFVLDKNNSLVDTHIDREYFFRRLHPSYNPLVTRSEASFLRGACYYFRRIQQHTIANTIDILLRTPQYDNFYCRKLLELGCLDTKNTFQRERALYYVEKYENQALDDEESSRGDSDSGEESMEMETDGNEEFDELEYID